MIPTNNSQHIQDIIYIEAYRAWIAALPPDKRAKLVELNLTEPDTNRKTNKGDDDLALTLASCEEATWGAGSQSTGTDDRTGEDEADCAQPVGDAMADNRDAATVAVALAAFCARVRSHPNPLLAFDTLCFATGLMGLEGRTQTALAQVHGVTNAAFSKQVLGWLDIFDLTPPRGCHSLRTRDNLTKARQLLRHKRPNKAAAERKIRRRNRYPDRSADPTVVFVRGLDLFRRWFRKRCRKLPLRRWSPEAREILRVELAWFATLHSQLIRDLPQRRDRARKSFAPGRNAKLGANVALDLRGIEVNEMAYAVKGDATKLRPFTQRPDRRLLALGKDAAFAETFDVGETRCWRRRRSRVHAIVTESTGRTLEISPADA